MRSNKFTLIIVNIYIYFVLFLWSCIALPVGILVLFLYFLTKAFVFRKYLHWMSHLYGRVFLRCIRPFVPVMMPERYALLRHAPCIVVANHQTMLDLFLFACQKETKFVYAMKAWPLRLFFYAPFMRALGYIVVEGRTLEEIEKECLERLAEGISIVFFPEGTRSRTKKIGRFYSGAFQMALLANVCVLPILFENSGDVVPVGSVLFHPQELRMRFLAPLFPNDFLQYANPHRAMMQKARACYIEAMEGSRLQREEM